MVIQARTSFSATPRAPATPLPSSRSIPLAASPQLPVSRPPRSRPTTGLNSRIFARLLRHLSIETQVLSNRSIVRLLRAESWCVQRWGRSSACLPGFSRALHLPLRLQMQSTRRLWLSIWVFSSGTSVSMGRVCKRLRRATLEDLLFLSSLQTCVDYPTDSLVASCV